MSVAQHTCTGTAEVELCLDSAVDGTSQDGDVDGVYHRLSTSQIVMIEKLKEAVYQEKAMEELETKSYVPISLFEAILTAHPPILESLLSQLPTTSILDLFHTSRNLREFLKQYPLAWKTLSFRLPQPAPIIGSPGHETPDGRERQSRQYALDGLLIQVVVPLGTRLRNLDLCNTAVSGVSLVSRVLQPRISTIQHLSVRGCKNVSIKYHLVPFLEPYTKRGVPWATRDELALKSLYAYRCRHHRRRPYLPSSLIRKDSDSEPTHQLIEICHELGIWTDTAWCPTPAGRCFRRKDYHNGRAAPGTPEVWVPFDRLWRSCNRIGPSHESAKRTTSDGRLWEDAETGHDGEALGPEDGSFLGEGKDVPAHLRKSHKTFVENLKCSQCEEEILERCEQCSVRMHCMGCRKTLCASCAFNRPVPRRRTKTRNFTQIAFGSSSSAMIMTNQHISPAPSISSTDQSRRPMSPIRNRFWWAPGATRSPNLMQETTSDDDDDDDSEDGNNTSVVTNQANILASMAPLKLSMHWCCLEPIFSGGGGITFLGNAIGGKGADKIRAAPLPRRKQFEDPEFSTTIRADQLRDLKQNRLYESVLGEEMDIMSFLTQESLMLQESTCPRSLCHDCYLTFRWKVPCKGCNKPLCKEHDFRALKVRKCGYRDLQTEREFVLNYKNEHKDLEIPAYKRNLSPQSTNNPSPTNSIAPPGHSSQAGPSSAAAPPPPPPTHVSPIALSTANPSDMAPSISSRGFILDHAENANLLSPFARPRSLSFSDLRNRPSTPSWHFAPRTGPHARIPRPGHPRHPVQWEGCGSYYCQYPRSIGDSRQRCSAALKECKECGVYVCADCLPEQQCHCGFCSINFHCPTCTLRDSVKKQCVAQAEAEQAKVEAKEEKRRQEQEKESETAADDLANALGEFFTGLFDDGIETSNDIDASAAYSTAYTVDGEIIDDEDDEELGVSGLEGADELVAQAHELLLQVDATLEAVAVLESTNGTLEPESGIVVNAELEHFLEEDMMAQYD